MKNFGLIGKKLNHSISPFLHTQIARLYKNDISYQVFEIPEAIYFDKAVKLLKEDKMQGFNITIPYKEEVIPYLDSISDHALNIGAINTIYLDEGKVIGENTDYFGLLNLIKLNGINLENKHVIILGTGGAAKAALKVVKDLQANATLVTRNKEQAKIKENLVLYKELDKNSYDVIINATPIGMFPYIDETPLNQEFVEGKIVIDLIYNPEVTKLMSFSNNSVNGIEMLIIQAIYAQSLWFDKKMEITKEIVNELKELCNEYIRDTF